MGDPMTTTALRSPTDIEDAAIRFVLEREAAEGREARDARGEDAIADVVSGDRRIVVKLAGSSSRGDDLWLECREYIAARDDAEHFWLYLVDDVQHGDPSQFRLLRFGGDRLQELLERAHEQRYYAVPLPVAVYDAVAAQGG
jgi:hypothetical protein